MARVVVSDLAVTPRKAWVFDTADVALIEDDL